MSDGVSAGKYVVRDGIEVEESEDSKKEGWDIEGGVGMRKD